MLANKPDQDKQPRRGKRCYETRVFFSRNDMAKSPQSRGQHIELSNWAPDGSAHGSHVPEAYCVCQTSFDACIIDNMVLCGQWQSPCWKTRQFYFRRALYLTAVPSCVSDVECRVRVARVGSLVSDLMAYAVTERNVGHPLAPRNLTASICRGLKMWYARVCNPIKHPKRPFTIAMFRPKLLRRQQAD